MAKFNPKRIKKAVKEEVEVKVTNLAGATAHGQSAKLELASILLTNMVQDQFYRSKDDVIGRGGRLSQLVQELLICGQEDFIMSAGIYARHIFGLRSITHVLAKIMALSTWGPGKKFFYDAIVRRPDDMTEILALIFDANKPRKSIPNAVKDGFSAAATRFDEYQLAKYKQAGKNVALVDVVNLVHPYPTSPIDDLVNGRLKNTQTWESQLSLAGQISENAAEKAEKKQETWEYLIASGKLGFLALLRNLRNIVELVTDEDILDELCRQLTDEKQIHGAKVFPFQIKTAFDIIAPLSRKVSTALARCADISLQNVPRFPGSTLIAMDFSGSMTSGKVGTTTAARIGSLFTASLWRANDGADLLVFGTGAKYWPQADVHNGLLQLSDKLSKCNMGGTNFLDIFRTANKAYDRIIIISDEQAWMGGGSDYLAKEVDNYRKRYRCDPKIYSFDLCGYGSLQFPEHNVYAMAGFSEKVFDVMALLERDREALIHEIEKIDCRAFSRRLHDKFNRDQNRKNALYGK